MCIIENPISDKKVTGYKVAVKRDGKYYSPAVGCIYKNGRVKPQKKQRRLVGYFRDGILNYDNRGFIYPMIGRTSIFKSLQDALVLRDEMLGNYLDIVTKKTNEELVILKSQLKAKKGEKILAGTYNLLSRERCSNVYIGSFFYIIGEVEY